jgi:phenol 2-monooxygenase
MKLRTEREPRVIDVLLVHSSPRADVELLRDLHETYHPFDPKLGWDYDKVFVDGPSYHEGHGDAYKWYGVDKQVGALVVVRPMLRDGLALSYGQ